MGRLHALIAGAAAATFAGAGPALALDWSGVPALEMVLFHTGQSSWEWLLVPSDHSGGEKMRKGKTCRECHEGEEAKIGELIASGEKLEPEPGRVHRASVPVSVQAAHDGERLHLRISWPAEGAPPSGPAPSVAVLLDGGGSKEMRLGGCFAACHADLTGMPHAGGAERTKYLVQSRVRIRRTGGGDALKPEADLAALLRDGVFLELWRLEGAENGSRALEGYVLEKRHESEATALRGRAELRGGRYVAELSRPLEAAGPGRSSLRGRMVTFGLAIHEQGAEGRFHLVSLEHTLAVDAGEADLVARRAGGTGP